jgi:hypothetical protein
MTSTSPRTSEEGPRRRIMDMGGRHKPERRSKGRATSTPTPRTHHQAEVMKKKRVTRGRIRRIRK